MPYCFLGDLHGNFKGLRTLGLHHAESKIVCLGDIGVFNQVDVDACQFPYNVNFIRGNHDNPAMIRKLPGYIPDGSVETTKKGRKIMYVGGACSIDHAVLTPGVDWWPDEELSEEALNAIFDLYAQTKPDIMVTHDAPQAVIFPMFNKVVPMTRTRAAFDLMLMQHKPSGWFFGHWHEDRTARMDNTTFRCLASETAVIIDL